MVSEILRLLDMKPLVHGEVFFIVKNNRKEICCSKSHEDWNLGKYRNVVYIVTSFSDFIRGVDW
jgi:hypothetical protein